MKVVYVDAQKLTVELSYEEFGGLTHIRNIGDSYYQVKPQSLIGKEYCLDKAMDSLYDLKCVVESKNKILEELELQKEKIERAIFPVEIPVIYKKENENG